MLDRYRPRGDGRPYADQIAFVVDRPGHDKRYAINATIREELGWVLAETLGSGMEKMVRWYLNNEARWQPPVAVSATQRRGAAA